MTPIRATGMPLPQTFSDAERGAALRPIFFPLRSARGRGRGRFLFTKPFHTTCPMRERGPRSARDNQHTPSRPVAALPLSWERIGDGRPVNTQTKAPQ